MKKLLTLAALLLALTACGSQEPSSEAAQQPTSEASQPPATEAPQQLSTEDTCSELEESFAIFESESEPSDEQVAELGGQLEDLATRAADPLQAPLQTMAAAFSKGRDEIRAEAAGDPALMEELDDIIATVSEECGL